MTAARTRATALALLLPASAQGQRGEIEKRVLRGQGRIGGVPIRSLIHISETTRPD